MSILYLLLVLVAIGVIVWFLTTQIPMDPGIAKLTRIVGIFIAILYILYAFGFTGSALNVRVPQVR